MGVGELAKERAAAALEAKCIGSCIEILVCTEPHTNPTDPARPEHIHAYVHSERKWDTGTASTST